MKILLLLLLVFFYFSIVLGQNEFKAVIKDSENKQPLAGANAFLQGTTIGASADQNGLIEIKNIPDGQYIIIYSFVGYQDLTDTLNFPLSQSKPDEVLLSHEAEETEPEPQPGQSPT